VLVEALTLPDISRRPVGPQAAAPRRGEWPAEDDVDINLERFASRVDASGWTCYSDSVRAQLASVIQGQPPPPNLSSSRLRNLTTVSPAKAVEPLSVPADEAARTESTGLADSHWPAGQIEQLTRRAEAAEARVRALEAHIAAEQQCARALGRRFGQKPHELFPAFVARLGMAAKAGADSRGRCDARAQP
jgi:hypothetical protein